LKPVTMRHDSDCTASVLAALFELPIETMPDFWTGAKTAVGMYDRVRRWCAARGFHWHYSTYGGSNCPRLSEFVKAKPDASSSFPPHGYWVAQISSVDRLRDNDPNHAVVMKGHRLVFNPGGNLKQALHESWFLIGYYLLVPLDPSKVAAA
jgi:hypothetical protein